MIGKLKGIVDYITEESLILDVNGVGYTVYIPQNVLVKINLQDELNLFIETQVREDSITLFGFMFELDKKLFNLLKTVQGVGPKLAMTIVSKLNANELQSAVMLEDYKLMQTVPGVGAKVAVRIVSELKDKIDKIFMGVTIVAGSSTKTNNSITASSSIEARNALVSLGYSGLEAKSAINYAINELPENSEVEVIIKKALQYFNSNKNS